MVQPSSVTIAALAALASTATAALAQAPQRVPQWPVTIQDARGSQPGLPGPGADTAGAGIAAPDANAAANSGTAGESQQEHGWTDSEIATAKERCNVIIAQYDVAATPMDPIRDGSCGSPHPVQLTRIGAVTLSQPATVNCEVIAALGDWLKVDVQPAAKQFIGARVTSLEVLSSYSCRNAYGRKRTRMSEHGRANAIDIKGFDFDHDKNPVYLLSDWGMTEREIKARIAAAEAAAKVHAAAREKAEAEARAKAMADARTKGAQQPAGNATVGAGERPQLPQPTSDGLLALRGMVQETFGKSSGVQGPSALSLGQSSRLGGPKSRRGTKNEVAATSLDDEALRSAANGYTAHQQFLRAIHAAACKRFGTVLGPEANEAHRNHFHLDMADRGGRGSYCR